MAGKAVSVIAGILALALIGAIIYAGSISSTYGEKLRQKENEIQSLQAQVEKLKSQVKEASSEKESATQETTQVVEKTINCPDCHGDVSGFHEIALLQKLDEKKGIDPPRICINCHGEKIHKIHEKKIQNLGVTMCKTCHMSKSGDFRVPEKRPGDVLVCQLCHFDGNYIKIHKAKCERCHYGKVLDIHKPLLEKRYSEIKELGTAETAGSS